MSFASDIAPYTLPNGVVTLTNPATPTDNGNLYTKTRHYLGWKLGEPQSERVVDLNKYLATVESRRIVPGLFMPFESWDEATLSHDEIGAIALLGRSYAEEIFKYGSQNCWVYLNRGRLKDIPGQWVYRMGYLVPLLYALTGRPVPVCLQVWYALDIKLAARAGWGETSTRCLYALHDEYADQFPPIMRKAYDLFRVHINREYGGLGGLYQIYFGRSHPFTTHTLETQL